jgi:hypothetical protein
MIDGAKKSAFKWNNIFARSELTAILRYAENVCNVSAHHPCLPASSS